MDIPIPEPVFDVDAWFKSTFNFDGHGNLILHSTNYKIYYHQLENIIKKIGNSQSENVLKYIKKLIDECTLTYITGQGYQYSKIKRIRRRHGKFDDEIVEEFRILESDFNKFASRGLWHDKFKENRKNGSEYAYLYLAWENECLRKKVEELDNTMKIIINMGLVDANSIEKKPEKEMICFCKKVVVKRCVKSDTPNKGKYYLSCSTRSCKFFTWCPDNLNKDTFELSDMMNMMKVMNMMNVMNSDIPEVD